MNKPTPIVRLTDQDLRNTITEYFNDHDKVCLNVVQDALVLLIVEVMGSAPVCDDCETTIAEACGVGEDRPEVEDSDISLKAEWYDIVVTARPDVILHELDEHVAGEYAYFVMPGDFSQERALDEFHNVVPIKVLDDFDIVVSRRNGLNEGRSGL